MAEEPELTDETFQLEKSVTRQGATKRRNLVLS
jgi:hypothetical protein